MRTELKICLKHTARQWQVSITLGMPQSYTTVGNLFADNSELGVSGIN